MIASFLAELVESQRGSAFAVDGCARRGCLKRGVLPGTPLGDAIFVLAFAEVCERVRAHPAVKAALPQFGGHQLHETSFVDDVLFVVHGTATSVQKKVAAVAEVTLDALQEAGLKPNVSPTKLRCCWRCGAKAPGRNAARCLGVRVPC